MCYSLLFFVIIVIIISTRSPPLLLSNIHPLFGIQFSSHKNTKTSVSRWQNFMNKLLRLTFHFKSLHIWLVCYLCSSYNCLVKNFELNTNENWLLAFWINKKLILKYLLIHVCFFCWLRWNERHARIYRKKNWNKKRIDLKINNKHV